MALVGKMLTDSAISSPSRRSNVVATRAGEGGVARLCGVGIERPRVKRESEGRFTIRAIPDGRETERVD
jgi:hypothetical protein